MYGETTDKAITNVMFITIAFFPTLILTFSLIQWRLDKRKHARMDAAKAPVGERRLARRLVIVATGAGMNYFVTGATGFIGRHLVERLLERDGDIYVLVREGSTERARRADREALAARRPRSASSP